MQKVTVNEDVCKSCSLCVEACPKGVIAITKERMNAKGFHPAAVTDDSGCISCAFCAIMCPDAAITVYKGV